MTFLLPRCNLNVAIYTKEGEFEGCIQRDEADIYAFGGITVTIEGQIAVAFVLWTGVAMLRSLFFEMPGIK